MRKWFFLSLLSSAPIFAEDKDASSKLFLLSTYDRYSLKTTDALEVDKEGSGYSLALGGYSPLGQGYLQYGIGFRGGQATGENYDRSQEVEVSDILIKLGYLYPIPGVEPYLHAGLVSDISTGKGSSLGYEDTESIQTVARLAPIVHLRFPVGGAWSPYLEASYAWDLNNKFYRENRSSYGLGILLELGQTAAAEPLKSSPVAVSAPEPIPESAPQVAEETLAIGSGVLIFPLGEAELPTSLQTYAGGLAHILKEQADAWTRLSIIGYAENTETELYGADLSGKRAKSVYDFFLAQGINGERLGIAETPRGEGDTLSRQRVDIFLSGRSMGRLRGIETQIASKRSATTISLRLETLTMDKSKVDVGPKGKSFLIELAKLLKAHDDQWKFLTVTGFTDARGNAEINRRVATQRGERQATILINEGLPSDRVKSMGVSTAALLESQNPTSHWNRRAEIEIHGVVDATTLKAKIDELSGQ
ncbi:MAG TPA: OmpA family protein [Oligoflexus sp.]|uniref:OmpA family protein n=1 Tax=Oligoflexus sp. TaxID=1971216 RepID=UPI002D80618B|nr:OmpA family protein [Oligoflexus sp.]HET9241733.1 OmpA family protein [Oligoflexus sp.]